MELFTDATWRIDARCWIVTEKGHGFSSQKIVIHLVFTASAVNRSF